MQGLQTKSRIDFLYDWELPFTLNDCRMLMVPFTVYQSKNKKFCKELLRVNLEVLFHKMRNTFEIALKSDVSLVIHKTEAWKMALLFGGKPDISLELRFQLRGWEICTVRLISGMGFVTNNLRLLRKSQIVFFPGQAYHTQRKRRVISLSSSKIDVRKQDFKK